MNAQRMKNLAARRELRLKMAVDRARLTTGARLAAAQSTTQMAVMKEKLTVYGSGALIVASVAVGVALLFKRKPSGYRLPQVSPLFARLKMGKAASAKAPVVGLGRMAVLLQIVKYLPALIQLSRRHDVRQVLASRPWKKRARPQQTARVDDQGRPIPS